MTDTKEEKLTLFQSVMDEVYGKYTHEGWTPKPYKENKGRYLWTDAFGVCNFITLYYETKQSRYLDQADALIKIVHNVLGKDRQGKARLGDSTDDNPLKGGLRIGKADPEGTPDGDGQYFHYLTKWMFALNRMSKARNDSKYNNWAIQLAKATHSRFVYGGDSDSPHMYWKMSIDLKKPHVLSEGNLDPFDGYITYRLLQGTAQYKSILAREIAEMEKMVIKKFPKYSSDDPLDLGEALWISHFFIEEEWANRVQIVSLTTLEKIWKRGYFDMKEFKRLAFREFGTTIGVQTSPNASKDWVNRVNLLHQYWLPKLYSRDKDITPVMFCTSLIPGVFMRNYP